MTTKYRKKRYVCPKCGNNWRQAYGSPRYVGVCYLCMDKLEDFISIQEAERLLTEAK